MLVIGAEGFGPPQPATKSRRRSSAHKSQQAQARRGAERAAGRAPIRILTEDEFCRLAGVPTPEALKRQYHAMRDLLARYRALREDHLRYLVKCGIIRPVLRTNADTFFAFPDLAVIKQANDELSAGRVVPERRPGAARVAPGPAGVRFPARRRAGQDPRAAARRRPRRPQPPARRPRSARATPRWPRSTSAPASALDDGDEATQEQAAAAYRKALELDPYLVAALINLANIHYSRDELVEAQALYERAIGLESDFFEAHFNLGNIYHDLGRFPEAQACYREALRLNPFYADAHFYLAVTFEKMGLSQEARPHWRAYQQLAPQGEWVELAKEFSE